MKNFTKVEPFILNLTDIKVAERNCDKIEIEIKKRIMDNSSLDNDLSFPLYNQLLASSTNKDVTTDEICLLINEAPVEHGEIIWALIVHHYTITAGAINIATIKNDNRVADKINQIISSTNDKNIIRLPYNGKMMTATKCPRFTYRLLPPNLQKVLANYVSLIKE